jgi:5-methylcytosine-specific restriction endonuclease McrA
VKNESESFSPALPAEGNICLHLRLFERNSMDPFAQHLDEADIKRERRKARELRASQWWKRRLAKGVCHYCTRPTPPRELTMDHMVPIARGGRSTKGNVVPCCKECNTAKKQLLPMEWEQYLKNVKPDFP